MCCGVLMVRCWGSGVDLPARCRRRCRRLLARESYAVCNGRRALLLLREATASDTLGRADLT